MNLSIDARFTGRLRLQTLRSLKRAKFICTKLEIVDFIANLRYILAMVLIGIVIIFMISLSELPKGGLHGIEKYQNGLHCIGETAINLYSLTNHRSLV